MNYFIVGLFISPMVLTILPMAIIVKYLNNKAIIKRNIQDQIQIDLAVVTLVYVYLYSSMFIARELFGPLGYLTVLNIALWILQCVLNMGFNCIISLELIQFANIFSLPVFSDWPESHCIRLHRILVFPLGVIIGSGLCSVGAGSCRKSPIYNYFIIDSLQTDVVKTSLLAGISWILYGIIILTCQISVEVKRFMLNRADQRADNMASNANRQLQQAVSMLKINTRVELGIQNLPLDNHPKPFHAVTKTLNKIIPDSERNQKFVDGQKSSSCPQTTEHDQDVIAVIRDHQMLETNDMTTSPVAENLIDTISVAEEIPIQALNQTLDSINNSNVDEHIDLPRSLHRHNQDASLAWEKNDGQDLDESIQVDSNNQLSRDQVMNYHEFLSRFQKRFLMDFLTFKSTFTF